MSRSYKRTPRSGDRKSRDSKKKANRAVRRKLKSQIQCGRDFDLSNHSYYKRLTCPYDICDYETVGESFEEYLANVKKINNALACYGVTPKPMDRDELRNEYEKYFIRK